MLARVWGKGEPSCTVVGMQTGAATVEISIRFHKKLKMKLPCDPVIPLLGVNSIYSKDRFERQCELSVHCSVIHNSQAVEVVQLPIHR